MWTSNNKACWEVQKQTCSVPTGFSAALSLTLMDKKLRWAVSSLISLYPVSADIRCAAHSKWVDLQMPFAQLVHASRGSDTQMSTVVSHNHLWSLITLLQPLHTTASSKWHFGFSVWKDAGFFWACSSTLSSEWKLGLTVTFDCVRASVHTLFISSVEKTFVFLPKDTDYDSLG